MNIKEAANNLLKKGEMSKEEYNAFEKLGAFSGINPTEMIQKINPWLILAAGAAGLGALAKEEVVNPIIQASKIKKSYEDMKSKVPQLEDKDEDQVKDYFNVVRTFSPKAASNPLVAGALVNKMMEFGGVDHKLVQDIAAIQAGNEGPTTFQNFTQAATKSLTAMPQKDKPHHNP